MHQTLTRILITGISFARLICVGLLAASQLNAGYLDDIGLTALRARESGLDGTGVTVAQVEASTTAGDWQTDPANMGLSSGIFRYFGSSADYPGGTNFNSALESGHANTVGNRFFGATNGVAPGVTAIQNFYAGYYYNPGRFANDIIDDSRSTAAKVVNQSFVFGGQSSSIDQAYDNYAANHDVLFCNGLNTITSQTSIPSPASSYNCIAVGTVNDSLTPLADGRSKPDIVAPGSSAASYTTPLVAGAATLLVQSANRGDADTEANTDTESDASDIRTIKALLLNSATKPSGWSHTSTHPLDTTNGAGILEVDQAQLQLAAGQYGETVDDSPTSSAATHLPPTNPNNIASNTGWNLGSITNTKSGNTYYDVTDHYFFNCDAAGASTFNLTATLVWNRNLNRTNINNLDLFLYKLEDENFEVSSISTVDNVEHLYELNLAPGRYVLQVHKPESGRDSDSETYALAFNFEEGAPVAASGASATATSSSTIDLSWNDNAGNETGYRIERRISGGSYSTLTTLSANTGAYKDATCAAGTSYDYQIIATNDDGDAPAAETSATTYSIQEEWRLLNFGSITSTGDGADDADPEFDGLVNLIEFATGSDPDTASPNPIDHDQLSINRQFSFIWRTNSGLDFSIGYSEDLAVSFTYYTSTVINSGSSSKLEFIESSTIDSEFESLTYGIKDSVTSDKAFIQLQIESP